MKAIILMGLIMLASCKVSKIHTGTYRVATATKISGGHSVVQLEGLNKEFVFPTDTLKKGDLVYFVPKP